MTSNPNLAIVGAGVIGLAIAWRAAASGHRVTVFDPDPARGASWVAGGMLAPVTEAWPGEEAVLELGEESLRRWPAFARELAAEGFDPGLSYSGTIVAAFDHADAEQLRVLGEYLRELGREATYVTGRELRRTEGGLSGAVRGGLVVPGDLAVDNRRLLDALLGAARRHGARFVAEAAEEVTEDSVRTASGERGFDTVVLAAGAWSGRLAPELTGHVRPLKGEILRLRARRTTLPPPERTVRAFVEGRPVYLVPRADGELVLGATQYEAGFDPAPTARGVRELLEGAERIFPAVAEYELTETKAGLRAASADNLPYLGELGSGVLAATGHHRNGLLLAPVTADAVLALLADAPLPPGAAAAHPNRIRSEERV
ncbi:glycine oxidase ThiO [Prauserella sp. PE36]|uniref:glycine oxidase ThiO n=1 Tax=Prauserella sp. PE36 TaxID=1504709 RepID=UPI000D83CE9B|nr:glycine oxidase ThiO [Prauserella sp. PE36]PXY37152.1 glycine oxidase ThiO [Prauserella coralliicola]RBM10199.1 glycine oxidase ThiO [Prauserella sp. PE36]